MLIYGVDCGVTGAVAVIQNGELVGIADLPVRQEGSGTVKRRIDPAGLAAIVRDWRARCGVDSELAVIERVAAMPKQGSASTFSLGHSAGAIEAVFAALGCPIEYVAPATWKRAAGISRDKADSRAKASLLFPAHAGNWLRARDHNRAEAVLLAAYGWKRAV